MSALVDTVTITPTPQGTTVEMRTGAASMTNSQFRLSAAEAEQPPVVTATGDIDSGPTSTSSRMSSNSAAADSDAITVDLSDVSYCDSARRAGVVRRRRDDQTRADRARDRDRS